MKQSSKSKNSKKPSLSWTSNSVTPEIQTMERAENWNLFIFRTADFSIEEALRNNVKEDSVRDNTINDANSFQNAMKSIVVLGQWFGLMPVLGTTGLNASQVRFKWCTVGVAYAVLSITGDVFMIICCCLQYIKIGMSFSSSSCLMFYGCSLAGRLLFLQLAKEWPDLAHQWEFTELSLKHYSYPTRLKKRINRISALFLFLSLFEHMCSNVSTAFESMQCPIHGARLMKDFFYKRLFHVFMNVPYDVTVACVSMIISFTATFVWNYMNLFIMIISISIVERLKQVNERLDKAKDKILPYSFWRQIREDYNSLSYLTKVLDEKISKIILLTFGCNLYFMCLRLLYTIQQMARIDEIVYFVVAFGFMLFRTCAVCLYASAIHDQSKEPKCVLYTVPAEGYSLEVQRFLQQVTSDDVVLTGLNFFAITRGLILTIAGTIVTYEIVLVQFNSLNVNNETTNITVICENSGL